MLCLFHVLRYAPDKRFQIRKFFLISQLMQKMYAQMTAVNFLIEIEQVDLQHRLAILMHGRANAQTGYAPDRPCQR